MSGADSRDGRTDGTRWGRTLGVRHRNILNQVAMEPSLKTEAPGLRGMGQALGPQAWPGTSLPRPAPPPVYTVGRAMSGSRGQAGEKEAGVGRGREQPGPEAGPWGCDWGEGPDWGWVVPEGPRGDREVTRGAGGTAASHRGS